MRPAVSVITKDTPDVAEQRPGSLEKVKRHFNDTPYSHVVPLSPIAKQQQRSFATIHKLTGASFTEEKLE